MIVDQFNVFLKNLQHSLTLIDDSETGGQMPEIEQVQEKIRASKNRRIPIVKLLLLFVAIVMTIIVLEYFI
jgi:hypothetical protein